MKALRYCCYVLGTALLLAALFLVLHNLHEDRQSGEQAENVLSQLVEEIPEETQEPTVLVSESYDLYAEYEQPTEPVMETAVVDGQSYIGYLSIPDLEIKLPVMADWSYPNLKTAPCRYTGNLYTDDLIIAAHNYASHFGKIGTLPIGAELIFTDVKGQKHEYAVCEIVQLPGTAVEDMQFGDDWDLTLFTCTLNGQSRVTVRAERKEQK